MKKILLFTLYAIFPFFAIAQVTFTDNSSLLVNSSLTSGCAIGVSDMNADGLDDIVRLDDARNLQIEYQGYDINNNLEFTRYNHGSIGGSQWGLCIADVDRNGFNDVFAGGAYNGLKLITANATGTAFTTNVISNTANGQSQSIFLQSTNFADIDNNGTIDIFGCHDDGISSVYNNDGAGNMTYDLGLIFAESTIPSDNSGNYGTIWTDYDSDGDLDLYISKCRLGVGNTNDGRRVNLLFQNDGAGNYTDVALAAGLRPYAQSWSANFEDIDNDGDMDCVVINHDISSVIYENNNGIFSDITASTGIATELNALGSAGIQIAMEDFDNDTFIDILITVRSGNHYIFKNNGNKTFGVMPTPFPGSPMQSAALGDINNDGFIDVVAGYATGFNSPSSTPDALFLNNGNSNNWCEILLRGNSSNINGIGARIEIYGAWGMQSREVRSGESYGTMNSLMTHFGLAAHTAIDKIRVNWPSGNVDEVTNPSINQSFLILEGSNPLSTESLSASSFNVYPNPTTDFVTISTTEFSETINIDVYNITGKKVNQQTQSFNTEFILDVSSYSTGIYFIHLETGTKSYVHKLIKD